MNANMNPKDTELAKLLEASAENVNPNPAFIAHLEDQIKSARKTAPRLASKTVWRRLPGVVTHTFTHFPLVLTVYRTSVGRATPAPAGTRWTQKRNLAEEALPNVMRKVIAHALGNEGPPGPTRL